MTPHVISARFARREHWRHGDPPEQYVWDTRYIDAPVLRWHDGDTNGTVDDTLYVMNDANFNVTGLVNATTGDVVERYIFTAYGERTVLYGDWSAVTGNTSQYEIALGHQGLWLDVESVLYYVRNRMYDPTLGRWLQRDPGGYVDGMSLYQFVSSTPLEQLDPLGLVEIVSINGVGDNGLAKITMNIKNPVSHMRLSIDGVVAREQRAPEGRVFVGEVPWQQFNQNMLKGQKGSLTIWTDTDGEQTIEYTRSLLSGCCDATVTQVGFR